MQIHNKLSTRQAAIIMIIGILSFKFITYPALYAAYAGRDGYIAMLINLIIELVYIGVMLWVMQQNPNKSFSQVLTDAFGQYVTKAVNFVLFIYFLIRGAFLMKEHYNYLVETLFVYLPWPLFVIPMMLLMGYIMNRSLRAIGRSAEIFFPLIIIAIVITLIIPGKYIDLSNLMPVLENGLAPAFKTAFYCNFSVGDFALLFIIMGNVKMEKNTTKKVFTACVFACVLVMMFYVTYFSVFGITGLNENIAINDLPLFSSFPSTIGRIDWITINLWTVCIMFQTGVALAFSLHCFNKVFDIKGKSFGIVFILSLILIFTYIIFVSLAQAVEILSSPHLNFISNILQTLLLILMFFSTIIKRREKVEFNKKVVTK